MEKNKEIGKLFKEKLDFLNKSPKDGGWDAIQIELEEKKKKRRYFMPFWFCVLGLFFGGIIISNHNYISDSNFRDFSILNEKSGGKAADLKSIKTYKLKKKNKKSIETKNTDVVIINSFQKSEVNKKLIKSDTEKSSKSEKVNGKVNKKSTLASQNSKSNIKIYKISSTYKVNKKSYSNKKNDKKWLLNKKQKRNKNLNLKVVSDENLISDKNSPSKNNIMPPNENHLAKSFDINKYEKNEDEKTDSILKKKLEKQIVESKEKDSSKHEENIKGKITLFAFASPTLSVLNSRKSLIDRRLNNYSKNAKITLSYGLYLCFEGAKRYSLRVGIAKNSFKFATKNAPINTSNYSGINYLTGISNSFIYSQSNYSQQTNIIQNVAYIEVPLEAKYKIMDKKFSLNGIIGFSYLFLDRNEVYFETSNGTRYKVGETSDLMKQTLSINLGMGLDYKITNRLKFNIEPIIKYSLRSSRNNNDSNPIYINILSGFEYRFGE